MPGRLLREGPLASLAIRKESDLSNTSETLEITRLLRLALTAFEHQHISSKRKASAKASCQRDHRHEDQSTNKRKQADIARIRHLLDDTSTFELQPRARRRRVKVSSGCQILEQNSYQLPIADGLITIETTKRWLTSQHPTGSSRQHLHHFTAKVGYVPSDSPGKAAFLAELCETETQQGLSVLTPTITFSPVVDPSSEIFRLVELGDIPSLKQLLRSGKASVRDCDPLGCTVLHRAAYNVSADMWSFLISEGAVIDANSSPLYLLVGVDTHQKLRLALEAGADPTLWPQGGQFFIATFMCAGAVRTCLRVCRPYIDFGLRDESGKTMILAASGATHNPDQATIIRTFIKAGVNVKDRDQDGNTCLHLLLKAAQPRHPQVVDALFYLLQAGADPYACNKEGYSAIDIACQFSLAMGSFRRDLLLQAIIECQNLAIEDALLRPPVFGEEYEPVHCAVLYQGHISRFAACGVDDTTGIVRMQHEVVNKLARKVDFRMYSGRTLHQAAVNRVLHQCVCNGILDFDTIYHAAHDYLQSMLRGNKQAHVLIKTRIPHHIWYAHGHKIYHDRDIAHWLKLIDEADTAALLEFDWYREVDAEDIFVGFVENMIDRLKEMRPTHAFPERLDDFISVLDTAGQGRPLSLDSQTSIPDTTESRSLFGPLPKIVTSNISELPDNSICGQLSEDCMKRSSIIETPVDFYRHDSAGDEGYFSADSFTSIRTATIPDSKQAVELLPALAPPRQWQSTMPLIIA